MSATKWIARTERGYTRSIWYRLRSASRGAAWQSRGWDGMETTPRTTAAEDMAEMLATDAYIRERTTAGRCRVCGTVAPLRLPDTGGHRASRA